MSKVKLSVIVPAYNESKMIVNTFNRLDRFFAKSSYNIEYIFVEDGSSDGTLDILKELEKRRSDVKVLVNRKNMGKGLSIKRGMLEATGEWALFMDADMSTPLTTFHDFEKYMNTHDIIMGSRWRTESNIKIPQPPVRRFIGILFYLIVKTLFLKDVTDTNCGFKCYRREVVKDIFSRQRLKQWGFDVELLYIAQKRHYRIKEVPVIWAHRWHSKVNLLTVPLLTLMELARIKMNDWRGRYDE